MITLTGYHGQSININEGAVVHTQPSTAEGVGCVIKMTNNQSIEVREKQMEVVLLINEANSAHIRTSQAPIDMLLNCSKCGRQHVDQIEHSITPGRMSLDWSKHPHTSHLCHGCGFVWRPADVPTNGVDRVKTNGQQDDWVATRIAAQALAVDAARWRTLPRFINEFQIDYVELVSRIDAEPKQ